MMQQQPKLSRAEVEQLLERAKAVPSISFGYIRLAQYCLAYMDALAVIRDWENRGQGIAADMKAYARAVLPASEATDE